MVADPSFKKHRLKVKERNQEMSRSKRTSKDLTGLHLKVDQMIDKATKPYSSIIGMAPCLYYGTATEDVNIFIDEAERASRHNQWGNGPEAVVRLAYFLEGNAKHAFDAEVADRTARRKQEKKIISDAEGAAVLEAHNNNVRTKKDEANNIGQCEPRLARYELWKGQHEKYRAKRKELRAHLDEIIAATGDLSRQERVLLEQLSSPVKNEGESKETGHEDEVDAIKLQKELNDLDALRVQRQADYTEAKAACERHEQNEEAILMALDSARRDYEDAKVLEIIKLGNAGTKEDPVDLAALENDDAALAFPTLSEFFEWLRTVFEREEVIHAYMSEFYGRRQKKGEKIQDFALELMRLSKRSGMNVDEKERTQHFIDGLTRRMKKHMRREWAKRGQRSTDIHKWSEVLEMAKKLERDIPELCQFGDDDEPYTVNVNVATAADEDDEVASDSEAVMSVKAKEKTSHQADLLSAIKDMMSTMVEQVKANTDSCYNCGGKGHLSRDCQRPPSERTQRYRNGRRGRGVRPQDVQCYACGKFGHYANACNSKATENISRKPMECYVCGEVGHRARDCSRRKQSGNGQRV